jgi:hypothetical protein
LSVVLKGYALSSPSLLACRLLVLLVALVASLGCIPTLMPTLFMFPYRCRLDYPRAMRYVRPSLCPCALLRVRPLSISRVERLLTADLTTFIWLFFSILARRPLQAKQRSPSGKSTAFPFTLAATRPSFIVVFADAYLFLSSSSLQVRQRPLLVVETGVLYQSLASYP